jgi:hypothetical protein
VQAAPGANAQCRPHAGAEAAGCTPAKDVKKIRARREVQKQPRNDEETEIVDAKHKKIRIRLCRQR